MHFVVSISHERLKWFFFCLKCRSFEMAWQSCCVLYRGQSVLKQWSYWPQYISKRHLQHCIRRQSSTRHLISLNHDFVVITDQWEAIKETIRYLSCLLQLSWLIVIYLLWTTMPAFSWPVLINPLLLLDAALCCQLAVVFVNYIRLEPEGIQIFCDSPVHLVIDCYCYWVSKPGMETTALII